MFSFRGGRLAAFATAGGAVALVLAGCASSASSGSSGSSPSASASGGTASAGLAYAQQQIAKYSGVVPSYMPTEKLSSATSIV